MFYLVLIAVVVGVLFISGKESGPKSFAGYSAFTVLSGSMESEIPKGSLVVTKQVDPSELQIGDDITYLSNPTTTITHRIVGITENYADTGQRAFTTQGVMNSAPDKQPVPAANVVGRSCITAFLLAEQCPFSKSTGWSCWCWRFCCWACSVHSKSRLGRTERTRRMV
ncbi:MAG: signal peptidase I [Clostridia bacterium]